jgi:hypothetical protein
MAFAGLRHPEQFRYVTRAHVIAWRECVFNHNVAKTARIWLNASTARIWLKNRKRVNPSISTA